MRSRMVIRERERGERGVDMQEFRHGNTKAAQYSNVVRCAFERVRVRVHVEHDAAAPEHHLERDAVVAKGLAVQRQRFLPEDVAHDEARGSFIHRRQPRGFRA